MNDNKTNNNFNIIINKLSSLIFSKAMTLFLIVISIFMAIIIKDYDRLYHLYQEKTANLELENANYKSEIETLNKQLEEQQKKDNQYNTLNKYSSTYKIKEEINTIIKDEIAKNNLPKTKLNSVTVNENLGTTSNKDIVVLVKLSWSRQNTESMTKQMLKIYSDQIALKIAPKLTNGSEIALFWDAEYTGLNIKHSYYIKNNKLYPQ